MNRRKGGEAGFRDVMRDPEYRALWLADAQSLVGDQLARVALSVLVFKDTGSATLTAIAYALTFVPALLGGALLGGIADRLPRRGVMIVCDAARAVVLGLMALPFLPIGVVCGLLVIAVLLASPFSAARVAILPQIFPDDRFLVGQALRGITQQVAQLVGFAAGGIVIAAIGARAGLAFDAVTFAISALIIWHGVRARPRPVPTDESTGYLRSIVGTVGGIMRNPVLRTMLGYGWLAAFYIAPEGLAAPYAAEIGRGPVAVGLLLAAIPAGTAVGAWALVRVFPAAVRPRLTGPLAAAAGVALIPCALHPGIGVSLLLWFCCGLCCAYQVQAAATFVKATADKQRGQAYGFAGAGLVAVQGIGIVLFGLAASAFDAHRAVALAGASAAILAVVLMLIANLWVDRADIRIGTQESPGATEDPVRVLINTSGTSSPHR
jgi:MFS family permease